MKSPALERTRNHARSTSTFLACAFAAAAVAASLRGPLYGLLPTLALGAAVWVVLRLLRIRQQLGPGLVLVVGVYALMQPPNAARLLHEIGAPPLPVTAQVASGYQLDPYHGMRIEGTPEQLLVIAEAVGAEMQTPELDSGWHAYFRDRPIWWQPPVPLSEDAIGVRYWRHVEVPGGKTTSALLVEEQNVLYVLITTS